MLRKRLALTSLVVMVAACTVADSESVRTAGMAAYMEVIADGDGSTDVNVWMTAGSGLNAARIELQGDDRLLASNGIRTQQLSKKINIIGLTYGTTLNGDDINRRYEVTFERTIDSSTYSWTMLPDEFDITAPASNELIVGKGVELEWQTSNAGTLRMTLDMECSTSYNKHSFKRKSFTISDNGHHYLNLVELLAFNGDDPYSFDYCDVSVILESSKNGQLDLRFGEGGYIHGIQRRSRHFDFQPQP